MTKKQIDKFAAAAQQVRVVINACEVAIVALEGNVFWKDKEIDKLQAKIDAKGKHKFTENERVDFRKEIELINGEIDGWMAEIQEMSDLLKICRREVKGLDSLSLASRTLN